MPLPSAIVTDTTGQLGGKEAGCQGRQSWDQANCVRTLDVAALEGGKRHSGLESPLRPLTNGVLTIQA